MNIKLYNIQNLLACPISDELITAIKKDIEHAESELEKPESSKLKGDNFFAASSRDTTSYNSACNACI